LPKIPPSNIRRNKYYMCYGFFYNQECYAVAIWSSPVARNIDPNTVLELRRYAINEKCPKNTASWGLSRMVKLIKKKFRNIILLISYQDTEVHDGTIYKASGWEIGNKTVDGDDWNKPSRKRDNSKTTAIKIRWERRLMRMV